MKVTCTKEALAILKYLNVEFEFIWKSRFEEQKSNTVSIFKIKDAYFETPDTKFYSFIDNDDNYVKHEIFNKNLVKLVV